ncbi:histidine phosphatase family protein [Erythrobacter sp. HL-111]|uniref:SixA phosphatase family protein n=1 Tax=Erythrobacter sp. HL-111 TaxID=1798193 RepID=UPI0006DAF239|nr:histidine phosphatase family protein [Erythrobacter sp. HL-111]KPP93338.1 MAG: phosphohistidine phosphatase SixA [Erythrobacteraceae bacterium HL-111]SDR72689.1 phosphohistidine phosphatase [Erythrobacter sp. HL-111]
MKLLGLLRHAKSDWGDTNLRDFDRGLNERGRRGARVIGRHLRDHGTKWDLLLASPAVRVRETLAGALPESEPVFDTRLYLASFDTIIETVQSHAGAAEKEPDAVLVSGHNPGLQELILELVSPSHESDLFREAAIKFPTASYAILECPIDSWAELKPRTARLAHFARPRDLDPELGPRH